MFGPYFCQKDTNKEEDGTVHCDFGMKVGEFYTDFHSPVLELIFSSFNSKDLVCLLFVS